MHEANPTDLANLSALLGGAFPGHTMQRMRTPDGKYRYLYVSPEMNSAFGLDAEALTRADAVDHSWVNREDRAGFIAALERSAADLTLLDQEVRVDLKAGGHKWVRSIGRPRREQDGTVIWDGVALDVTDRRVAIAALERTLADAKRNELSEGRFAFIAASDVVRRLEALRIGIEALNGNVDIVPDEVAHQISAVASKFDALIKAIAATQSLSNAQPDEVTKSDLIPSLAAACLTRRQLEIMHHVSKGRSNRNIALDLGIAEGTVKLHMHAAFKKLGARNRTEAAKMCFD